jgi:SAM-dependent methyltransferase
VPSVPDASLPYESIGPDFFLAPAPGWLNLGLWEGDGSVDEAEAACRRLVTTLASALPTGGVIVDAGNGLGVQDPLIAELIRPRRLVAVNTTERQLAAGRRWLKEASAAPVVGDAARLPIADGTADGIISVEAAFHFSSRRAFFEQLLPGTAARRRGHDVRYLYRPRDRGPRTASPGRAAVAAPPHRLRAAPGRAAVMAGHGAGDGSPAAPGGRHPACGLAMTELGLCGLPPGSTAGCRASVSGTGSGAGPAS